MGLKAAAMIGGAVGGGIQGSYAGGFGAGFANIAIMGGAIRPPEDVEGILAKEAQQLGIKYSPVYRSGGLYGLGASIGIWSRGFAGFGRNIIVNANPANVQYSRGLWFEETIHYWQQCLGGWADVTGRLAGEQIYWMFGGPNPYYDVYGLEYRARWSAEMLGGY